jgi:hypothetical protein
MKRLEKQLAAYHMSLGILNFPETLGFAFIINSDILFLSLRSSTVERLICNQMVGGSNPPGGSNYFKELEAFQLTTFLLEDPLSSLILSLHPFSFLH